MSEFPPKDIPDVATIIDGYDHTRYPFPFNINTLNWNYNMNTQTYGTFGGRVTQVLSVSITALQIQGDAGSRGNLITMFENFKKVQDHQTEFKLPAKFLVPSRNLSFSVWLENFQMGWGVETVAYPYFISLEVNQDFNNVATSVSMNDAINRIAQGIGFSPDWTGLSTADTNFQYQDIQNALQSGLLWSTNSTTGANNGL